MLRKGVSFLLFLAAAELFAVIQIVMPSNPSSAEQQALLELQPILEKALQKKVAVVSTPGKEKAVFLGDTELARQLKLSSKDLKRDQWSVKTVNGNLLISGGAPSGVIYAALEFAEKELGVIFAAEDCTSIPDKKNYRWKDSLHLSGTPAFAVRGIYSYFGQDNEARIKFLLRNRLNLFFDEAHPALAVKWGISPVYGSPRPCHSFYDYTRGLSKEDEDILSMNSSGKRVKAVNASGPGQVCYSNPKTRRFFKKKLASYIRQDEEKGINAPVYVIDPNDNPSRCLCKECIKREKKYGSFSGVTLEFLNDIAEAFPHKTIMSSAYMASSKAPQGIKPRANVIIRIAQLGTEWGNSNYRDTMSPLKSPFNSEHLEQIKAWGKISNIAIWDYWILYAGKSNMPTLNTRAVYENAKFYKKHKVISLFAECEEPHITSFHALRLWLGARCMIDPDLDFNQEIDRFMSAYYGKAAKAMRDCHDLFEKQFSSLPQVIGLLDSYSRNELDKKFFEQADKLLDEAEKCVQDMPLYRARVCRERLSVDYAHLLRRRETGLTDTAQLVSRFQKNLQMLKTMPQISASRYQKVQMQMKNFIEGLQVTVSLPDFAADREVVADFTWPLLNRKAKYVVIAPDKDAAGGKTVLFKPNRFNKKPLNFGVFDASGKRQLKNLRPQAVDKEGFHYYSTGPFKLTKSCFIWVHPSWNLQADLSRFYDTSDLTNEVEAFISIKTKPYFSVDRILLLRKKK